ncbi:hypothetical protein IJD44_07570 [bacterium]|nr:hypothetical protein [bacterium]
MLITNKDVETLLDYKDLSEIFFSGCKQKESIGVETEKLLVYKGSKKAVKYDDVVKVLEAFPQDKWQRIYEQNNLMALKSDIGVITLEPGSQVELSLAPINTLYEITKHLDEFYSQLENFAKENNMEVLNSGIQPVSTFDTIEIIPKKRYEYMTKYLPTKGLTPFVMMRETAGIQSNFDYKSQEDAIRKLKLAIKMSPIISSIYSNSPVRDSKLTMFKSYRANSWLNVDEDRCGYISKKLFDKNECFTFKDYIDILLDIPMIFIQRGNSCFGYNKTFRTFMEEGYNGLTAEISDWYNHISLYFPDVRLKNYVEIRNHDAQNRTMTYSVPAFWKGIMYNNSAISEIEKILSKYTYEHFLNLRKNAPIQAIGAKLNHTKVIDLVKEFFEISQACLKSNNLGEETYLAPVLEYIKAKRVPADDIIEEFNKKN